jgi:HSP20 family protein
LKNHEDSRKHIHRIERWSGSFERIVTLPVSVDARKIKAQYEKGVLIIYIPKKMEAKPKIIKIHSA